MYCNIIFNFTFKFTGGMFSTLFVSIFDISVIDCEQLFLLCIMLNSFSVPEFFSTISFCISKSKEMENEVLCKWNVQFSVQIIYVLHVQGLFKVQIIAGDANSFIFTKQLTSLLVVALLAEHSFWFSGSSMRTQLPHAIKSFKSQKHDIGVIMAEVETVFNNVSTKEDPAWLTQWVIDNKLVCYIISYFQFKY